MRSSAYFDWTTTHWTLCNGQHPHNTGDAILSWKYVGWNPYYSCNVVPIGRSKASKWTPYEFIPTLLRGAKCPSRKSHVVRFYSRDKGVRTISNNCRWKLKQSASGRCQRSWSFDIMNEDSKTIATNSSNEDNGNKCRSHAQDEKNHVAVKIPTTQLTKEALKWLKRRLEHTKMMQVPWQKRKSASRFIGRRRLRRHQKVCAWLTHVYRLRSDLYS